MQNKYLTAMLLASTLAGGVCAQENTVQFMNRANAKLAKASAPMWRWDGRVDGPKMKKNKKIVYIASDMSDAGNYGIFNGIKEATKGSGWEMLHIDCRGRCNQGASIVSQALDMKPDGIILAGVDAQSQAKGLAAAAVAKVPVVGWHASVKAGPTDGLFTNITTNLKDVAQIAALNGVIESKNKTGIVVFTDSSNPYSLAKSMAIVDVIKQCDTCHLLSVEDVPVIDVYKKMPVVVESLTKKYGAKWTHAIGVNDLYFDLLEKPEVASLLGNNKVMGFSAGDGSSSAYKRIRANSMQFGTVPEPLYLHGWQLVDEMNRAFSGVQPSGYVTSVHLVTSQNIAYDGGHKNVFDPVNDFRGQYEKIWAK